MTNAAPLQQPSRTSRPEWAEHLIAQVDRDWRNGEFDPDRLTFVPDPDNPHTVLQHCRKSGCNVRVDHSKLCPTCRNNWAKISSGAEISFDEWLNIPRKYRKVASGCLVPRCPRSHGSRGLCRQHYNQYRGARGVRGHDDEVARWILEERPEPLEPAVQCLYLTCGLDADGEEGLCGSHSQDLRRWRKKSPTNVGKSADQWIQDLALEPFYDEANRITYKEKTAIGFQLLPEPLRWELLVAVQRRDKLGRAVLTPIDLRSISTALRKSGRTTLVGLTELGLEWKEVDLTQLSRALQRMVDDVHREWSGVDDRDPRVLRFVDLDVRKTSRRLGPDACLDLRSIRQEWIAETIIAWARAGRRGYDELIHARYAWTVADEVVTRRGTPKPALGSEDMDAIVAAIRTKWPARRTQERYINALRKLIDFARNDDNVTQSWSSISPRFAVNRSRHVAVGDPPRLASNTDEPFRFVPQPIIDWLMDHLHLLDRGDDYRTAEARVMLFLQERCGRRTGETTRLLDDCISCDDTGSPYLEWTQGKPPWGPGKRLPIHQETHDVIREWQAIKRAAGSKSRWLFPSRQGTADRHVHEGYITARLHEFIDVIKAQAPFVGQVEGAEGNLIYFDLDEIDPYSFRHAFAQRLADATDENGVSTTPPDVLQDYMGHKSFNTTMAYYSVTAKRRKKALASIPARRLNVRGEVVPVERERDSFGKIAVTLGSCSEPQNVAANGHFCSVNYACESCPFFLVDPLERDGVAAKRAHLKVQYERARAIRSPQHILDHLLARVADCSNVIEEIDKYIDGLNQDERASIRDALERMEDIRRRASAPRRIDLRGILRREVA